MRYTEVFPFAMSFHDLNLSKLSNVPASDLTLIFPSEKVIAQNNLNNKVYLLLLDALIWGKEEEERSSVLYVKSKS